MTDIANFLPIYKFINSPDFYDDIFHKKEFYDNRLDPSESKTENEQFYKHQKIIINFLASATPYNKILLFHEMGTGKSCSAIGAAEHIMFTPNNNGKPYSVIYMAPNDVLVRNFINEVFYKCTNGLYSRASKGGQTDLREMKAILKGRYTFYTFNEFAKENKYLNGFEIAEKFISRVVIIDEVHRLRESDTAEDITKFNIIKNFCRNLPLSSKLILLTGTPMVDSVGEIANIINLLSPQEEPTGKDFLDKFFYKQGKNLYNLYPDKVNYLKGIFKGYISYLKATENDIIKTFVGTPIKDIPNLPLLTKATDTSILNTVVFMNKMKTLQRTGYINAYKNDTHTKNEDELIPAPNGADENNAGVYLHSRQASLFVFPDGSYGSEGFKKFFDKKKNFGATLYNAIKGKTEEQTLENISNFSCIYHKVLQEILSNKDKCIFIYSFFVSGSGSIVLARLLEILGYAHARGDESFPAKRYALLSSNITAKAIDRINERFNRPDNRNGEFIQVIIGSNKLTEGVSFYHIQQEHIMTPWWNNALISQAMARGIRINSHRHLPGKTQVKIFLHACDTSGDASTPSIDLNMYITAEFKDRTMKQIERVLKESAVDCALTYERNKRNIPFSRDCDFQECNYTCDGIKGMPPYKLNEQDLDISTYQLYYATTEQVDIVNTIQNYMRTNFEVSLEDIVDSFAGKYEPFVILNTLFFIIEQNYPIINKYGFVNYLREENNVFFLVDNLMAPSSIMSKFYAKTPVLTNYRDDNIFEREFNRMMLENTVIESIKEEHLPCLPKALANQIINGVITGEITEQRFIEYFEKYITKIRNGIIVNGFNKDRGIMTCWDGVRIRECTTDEIKEFNEEKEKVREDIKERSRAMFDGEVIFGIYDDGAEPKNRFVIVDLRTTRGDLQSKTGKELQLGKTTGKVCESFQLIDLLKIYIFLHKRTPTNENFNEETVRNEIKKSGKFKFDLSIFDTFNKHDLAILQELFKNRGYSLKKETMCKEILEILNAKKLIVRGSKEQVMKKINENKPLYAQSETMSVASVSSSATIITLNSGTTSGSRKRTAPLNRMV